MKTPPILFSFIGALFGPDVESRARSLQENSFDAAGIVFPPSPVENEEDELVNHERQHAYQDRRAALDSLGSLDSFGKQDQK
jgi:hypothetical protein